MRFIYLSTTKESEIFNSRESTVRFFKEYMEENADTKFHFGDRKIAKNKFKEHEDIFFLRADKTLGYYSYEVIAYCRSKSGVKDTTSNPPYTHYFDIDPTTLRIFKRHIDIKSFQQFIDDPKNKVKSVDFTGNIDSNKFSGPYSWIYFDDTESKIIMDWFTDRVLIEEIEVLTSI